MSELSEFRPISLSLLLFPSFPLVLLFDASKLPIFAVSIFFHAVISAWIAVPSLKTLIIISYFIILLILHIDWLLTVRSTAPLFYLSHPYSPTVPFRKHQKHLKFLNSIYALWRFFVPRKFEHQKWSTQCMLRFSFKEIIECTFEKYKSAALLVCFFFQLWWIMNWVIFSCSS